MCYIFIYALYIERASYFHFPTIGFPFLGSDITPTENACLKFTPIFCFLLYCKTVLSKVKSLTSMLLNLCSVLSSHLTGHLISFLHTAGHSLFLDIVSSVGLWHVVFSRCFSYSLAAPSQVLAGFSLLVFLLMLEDPRAQSSTLFSTYTRSLGELIRHPGSTLIHVPMIPYFMFPPKVSWTPEWSPNCLLNVPIWVFNGPPSIDIFKVQLLKLFPQTALI